MFSPLLMAMLMSDVTPPPIPTPFVEEGDRLERKRVDQLKTNIRHRDLEGMLLETLMEAMQEAEEDPEKKDGIRIMRTIKRTSDCLHELKYFADLDKDKVKACDRADVLELLERIQDQISVFWKTRAKPEGTIWD